jgi:glycosyltransferase involved in cell wall biosynthesis
MNLVYLLPDGLPGWPFSETSLTADPLASRRLRAALPARHLSTLGHHIQIQPLGGDLKTSQGSGEITWLIIGKISHPDPSAFRALAASVGALVTKAKTEGMHVLVDYTDDIVAAGDPRSASTLRLLQEADRVVCASEPLASSVRRSGIDPSRIVVIADPVEGDRQPVHCLPEKGQPLRVLWFGHPTNLQPLLQLIAPLDALRDHADFTLEIVAGLPPQQLNQLRSQLRHWPRRYAITLTPWNGQASVFEALRRSQVAVIPIDRQGPKAAVSNNRLTEALWAGCFVVASPVASYLPFREASWLGEDLVEGLRWVIDNPEKLQAMVATGNEQIAAGFTPEAIAQQWQQALSLPGA